MWRSVWRSVLELREAACLQYMRERIHRGVVNIRVVRPHLLCLYYLGRVELFLEY